jgi:ABC-type Mn2+/Zn2+ transport system permease subunit
MTRRLLIGWGFGTLVSVIGMVASAVLDLPTGATVVCAFGLTLFGWWGLTRPSARRSA